MTAASAAINTAAAATSLATFASGWMFGESKSTTASTDVLTNSATHTRATVSARIAQSIRPKSSHRPMARTATEATA